VELMKKAGSKGVVNKILLSSREWVLYTYYIIIIIIIIAIEFSLGGCSPYTITDKIKK
jgi:hypothetical protein